MEIQVVSENSFDVTLRDKKFTLLRAVSGEDRWQLYIAEKDKFYNVGSLDNGFNAIRNYVGRTWRG